jgi:hypothetical protein
MNGPQSSLETAKCDVWATTELSVEEEIYEASHKSASYADLVFSELDERLSFFCHEEFARKLVELLKSGPEVVAAAEACIRRCYFQHDGRLREGFYITFYVNGYGRNDVVARQNWAIGLKLAASAIEQLSR